jgi:hypothetical protein
MIFYIIFIIIASLFFSIIILRYKYNKKRQVELREFDFKNLSSKDTAKILVALAYHNQL